MPAMYYYEVEQTRSVTVWANSPTDAMIVANREFTKASTEKMIIPESEIQGAPTTPVEVHNVTIRKEL